MRKFIKTLYIQILTSKPPVLQQMEKGENNIVLVDGSHGEGGGQVYNC